MWCAVSPTALGDWGRSATAADSRSFFVRPKESKVSTLHGRRATVEQQQSNHQTVDGWMDVGVTERDRERERA